MSSSSIHRFRSVPTISSEEAEAEAEAEEAEEEQADDEQSTQTPPPRQPPRYDLHAPPLTTVPRRNNNNHAPAIYTVPTTDTLGEDESWGATTRANRIMTTRSYSPTRTPPLRLPQQQQQQQQSTATTTTTTTTTTTNSSRMVSSGSGVPPPSIAVKIPLNRRRRPRAGNDNNTAEFRQAVDAAAVTVQFVPTAQRAAYSLLPAPSWTRYLQRLEQASRILSSSRRNHIVLHKRLSPAPQHLALLHTLQAQDWIRQVDFAPSVSSDADVPHVLPQYSSDRRGDGRFQAMDIQAAYTNSLPAQPPQLSHRKTRLPSRADVGWPGATPAEIEQKQAEIAHETEWEEATPRLVVLCTAADLGHLVGATQEQDEDDSNVHLSGLPGMPAAGQPLKRALAENARAWGKPIHHHHDDHHHNNDDDDDDDLLAPNPTSLLAPPLQATYSASLHWRPRLFHDRAPLRHYAAACPLHFEAATHDPDQPRLLSFALYQLASHSHQAARGKVSEDVWFPVGAGWTPHLQMAVLRQEAQDFGPAAAAALAAAWWQRRNKAVFSVPAAAQPQAFSNQNHNLVWVVKLYALPTQNPQAVLEQFGWDLLVPVALGVLPWKDGLGTPPAIWPRGKTSTVQFYSWTVGESPEDLLERITLLVHGMSSHHKPPGPSSTVSVESDSIRDTPSIRATPSKRPSRVRQLFRSPRLTRNTSKSGGSSAASVGSSSTSTATKHQSNLSARLVDATPLALHQQPQHQQSQQQSEPLEGWSLKLFVSFLGTDFLNALLSTPTELTCPPEISERLPRLVVDPTGDAAVSVPPPIQRAVDLPGATPASASNQETVRKRSDLVRLPPLTTAAGYTDAAEFREVLPMAPRLDRHYPLDTPFGTQYRSLLNLLYIYPRVLRFSSDSKVQQQHSNFAQVTVRVRLIQNEISLDENSGKILSRNLALVQFHSTVPWAGDALVGHVYTKIQGHNDSSGSSSSSSSKQSSSLDLNMGVAFGDEVKLRLPECLDGSYSLEFAIFQVQNALDDSGLSLTCLGETAVPLSSSSREASTGRKVTTVIPNGNHRVKLGEYQLQVETRLVSSIHVSDPAVALALRDFPFAKFQEEIHHGEYISSAQSVESSMDTKESFPTMLFMSNPSAVVAHARPLLHMHLCNLVNLNERGRHDVGAAVQFFSDNMQCLFEVLRCVKASFAIDSGKVLDEKALFILLKEFLDGFDEGYLSSASSPDGELTEYKEDVPAKENYPSIDRTPSADSAVSVASLSEGSVRMQGKRKLYKKYEDRVNKIVAAIGNSGTPFSRVAYGATQADRMRVEAEMDTDETGHHLFDDDETIMTDWTSPRAANTDEHSSQKAPAQNTNTDSRLSQAMRKDLSANSILHSASSGLKEKSEPEKPANNTSGNEFARRVRSAAQTMLAPCVGPSLSNILASARGASLATQTLSETGHPDEVNIAPSKSNEGTKKNFEFLPGSDDEDETDSRNIRPHFRDKDGDKVYRGPAEGPMFILSSKPLDEKEVMFVGGHFLYESIIVLWLRMWSSHAIDETHTLPSFPVPTFDPTIQMGNPIVSFFQHMDFLLPLCLKSIALRYTAEVLPVYPSATRVQLDAGHQLIFEQFAAMAARGLVGMSLTGLRSPVASEKALSYSLSSSVVVVEFFVGLMSVFHEEHGRAIVTHFLKVLKDTETEHLAGNMADADFFEWNEESLLRVRCSRQLRLRTIEILASLPSFCNLNYPCKVQDASQRSKPAVPTWLKQYCSTDDVGFKPITMTPNYPDGLQRAPAAGWLSNLVIEEALSVCSLSSEAVIAEALAHAEVSRHDPGKHSSGVTPSLKRRPGAALQRDDLLMFQSLSIHGITIVYELVLRRNAIDRRFQSDSARRRIAALFSLPILEKSVSSVRWLARMESTHKVRSLWLLCFVYVLQEAPDSLIQGYIRSCCDPKNVRVHRFIRLLRICSSTFQGFVDRSKTQTTSSDSYSGLPAWLLQESYNTICATTNTVVEACVDFTSTHPQEKRKVMQGLIDLLLHILTTPQSSVTHLRALGGALQAMEQFGVDLFLDVTGDNFQHWCRVLLSLMNSPSLSVRSISVDFAVSLLGGAFDSAGTIESVSLVLTTVLPEVVAREFALYNVSGQITSYNDVSSCVWPLRRALTDIQDTNPLDDDRVDPQLPPQLRKFGRACQAIIDGVLVEIRFCRSRFLKFHDQNDSQDYFDADEESLYEAAGFFLPETSPLQRIRWLLSLKMIHEQNERWIEAAETAMLCAETVAQSLPYLKSIWRPTNFALWTDSTRSHWLENVGEEIGEPDFGNREVMDFANSFLEPDDFLAAESKKSSASGRLQQPTLGGMCEMLNSLAKDSTDLYLKETGCEELALQKLEVLQKTLAANFEEATKPASSRAFRGRRRQVEDEAILRRMISNISVASAKLSERVLGRAMDRDTKNLLAEPSRIYVAVRISGKKLTRFQETVALPPFLEWDEYCICALPSRTDANLEQSEVDERKRRYSKRFGETLVKALRQHAGGSAVRFVEGPHQKSQGDNSNMTLLEVFPIEPSASIHSLCGLTLVSRRFSFRKADEGNRAAVDFTVALAFPCALSRQRSLVTTDTYFSN